MSDPRTLLVLATALTVLIAGSGVAAAGIAGPVPGDKAASEPIHQTGTPTTATNATNNGSTAVSPGARLSGVVGVQRAELEGEVAARSMGSALNATHSNASRARVLADEGERLEQRLQTLESRLAALEAAHENGTIPEGAYQAQAATLTARTNALADAVNQTSRAANALPPEVREQYGVNVTRLGELRTAAGNLTGPEVAAIARSIAGPNPGRSGLRGPPAHAGPPFDRSADGENRRGPPNGTSPGSTADHGVASNRTGGGPDRTGNEPGR